MPHNEAPATPENVQEVVAGLSDKMRRMLLWARPDWKEPPRCYGPANTKQALRARGLAHGDFAYLTPLGLAVRAHISKEKNDA